MAAILRQGWLTSASIPAGLIEVHRRWPKIMWAVWIKLKQLNVIERNGKGVPSTFSYSMHGTDADWSSKLAYPPAQHGMAALALPPQTRQQSSSSRAEHRKVTEYSCFGTRNAMAS